MKVVVFLSVYIGMWALSALLVILASKLMDYIPPTRFFLTVSTLFSITCTFLIYTLREGDKWLK